MERRKVMTIAAVLISVMVAAGACGKMMGDAPAPAEKAGVSSGDRKAPADSTEKAEAGTADTEKNEKERIKKQSHGAGFRRCLSQETGRIRLRRLCFTL